LREATSSETPEVSQDWTDSNSFSAREATRELRFSRSFATAPSKSTSGMAGDTEAATSEDIAPPSSRAQYGPVGYLPRPPSTRRRPGEPEGEEPGRTDMVGEERKGRRGNEARRHRRG